MKQENIIFLILVLASAMVLGTTFGVLNSYLASRHWEKAQQTEQASPSSRESLSDDATEHSFEAAESESTTTGLYGSISGSGTAAMLSPYETAEVAYMFYELGYNQPAIRDKVTAYQSQNNMTVTGVLDNTTLDSVLKELTLKKVQTRLR